MTEHNHNWCSLHDSYPSGPKDQDYVDTGKMSGSIVFTVIILSTVLLAQACPSIQSALTPDLVIGLGALVEADLDPDGHFISTLSEYALHLWYLNGSLVSVYPSVEGVPFISHAWSPHGSMIAVSDYLGRIYLVRIPELSIVAELDYEYGSFTWTAGELGVHPSPIKWSPSGSLIGLGLCHERCYIYNLSDRNLQIKEGCEGLKSGSLLFSLVILFSLIDGCNE